jgi:hypothetical protein
MARLYKHDRHAYVREFLRHVGRLGKRGGIRPMRRADEAARLIASYWEEVLEGPKSQSEWCHEKGLDERDFRRLLRMLSNLGMAVSRFKS